MFNLLSKYQCAKDLCVPFAAFVALLLFSAIFTYFNPESGWATVFAILPLIPAIWAVRKTVRLVKQMEVVAQEQQLVNFASSFVVTGLVTFTYGFLSCFANYPDFPLILVAPLMVVIWVVTDQLSKRRHK